MTIFNILNLIYTRDFNYYRFTECEGQVKLTLVGRLATEAVGRATEVLDLLGHGLELLVDRRLFIAITPTLLLLVEVEGSWDGNCSLRGRPLYRKYTYDMNIALFTRSLLETIKMSSTK